jgi:hypothetical protein
MHQIKGAGLNKLISHYNATNAGQPTPAGNALIAAGLMTQAQLVALGAVQQPLATAPTTPLNNSALRAFDAGFNYPIKLSKYRQGLSIEPGIGLYNVFNMSNFGTLVGQLANTTTAGGAVGTTANYLNGPNNIGVENGLRVQRGSGTYDLGAPRTTEFRLRVNF